MNWNKELEQKFIHLFETNPNGEVYRGIECCQGWKKHIERFLESLDFHLNNNATIKVGNEWVKDNSAKIEIFQIKEKFGEIRCYYSVNNDKLELLIERELGRLEASCHFTCGHCGKIWKF